MKWTSYFVAPLCASLVVKVFQGLGDPARHMPTLPFGQTSARKTVPQQLSNSAAATIGSKLEFTVREHTRLGRVLHGKTLTPHARHRGKHLRIFLAPARQLATWGVVSPVRLDIELSTNSLLAHGPQHCLGVQISERLRLQNANRTRVFGGVMLPSATPTTQGAKELAGLRLRIASASKDANGPILFRLTQHGHEHVTEEGGRAAQVCGPASLHGTFSQLREGHTRMGAQRLDLGPFLLQAIVEGVRESDVGELALLVADEVGTLEHFGAVSAEAPAVLSEVLGLKRVRELWAVHDASRTGVVHNPRFPTQNAGLLQERHANFG
mmetsp:Transcript_28953/g.67095  ORF Transcript_28953/g.67095 Transcript_28953/m.67095 type:complete len:324 (+) Transcript_28953:2-973(+)